VSKQDVIDILDELTNRLSGPVGAAFESAIRFHFAIAAVGLIGSVLLLFVAWRIHKRFTALHLDLKGERGYYGWAAGVAYILPAGLSIAAVVLLAINAGGVVAADFTAIKAFIPWT
jgi:hypothetical protein